MAVKSIIQNSYRDPSTAAIISIIPALGQLYNGQTRKGLLFLAVDAVNLLLFSFLIFTTPFVNAINEFGLANHLKPNANLKYALLQLHFGSAASVVLTGCLLTFIALAMRDAYDNAANIHRRDLYPGFVMELPEAASGSYLFHFSLLAVGFLLAFFFLVPPPPLRQITEIQFFPDQPKVNRTVVSPNKSAHASVNAGHPNPREETPSPPTTRQVQPATRNSAHPTPPTPPAPAQPRPTAKSPAAPLPQPLARPLPQPLARALPLPQPLPQPVHASSQAPVPAPNLRPNLHATSNATPTPIIRPAATANTNSLPQPIASGSNRSNFAPAPMPSSGAHAPGANLAGPAPAPVAVGSHSSNGTTPAPVPVSGQSGKQGTNPTQAPPTPTRSRFSQSGDSGPRIAMTPSIPQSGQNVLGGPHQSDKPTEPPSIATEPIDWGPYMADLQRRIKKAWYPPHGQETRRVVVVFKIHSNGELSHLRLTVPSGNAEADRQAMSAVENAAPFQHLPKGASEDADIQFTFDYHVFDGGR